MEARRQLRVLFIVPSLRYGGAEMQVVALVNGLNRAQFQAHLLYYDCGEALLDRVDSTQVKIYPWRKKGRLDLGLISAIAQLIDSQQIDVVHCTLQYSLFLAWAARLKARTKPTLVCAIHTTINRTGYEEFFDRALYRKLLRACAALIFVCETQREHWLRKYSELEARSHVVFNGIDVERFDPALAGDVIGARKQLDVPSTARMVTCLAVFRPEKGHDILVKAFARVLDEFPETYLVLAGDGPLRESVERLVSELGIVSHVRFPGGTDNVRALLGASDLTVLSSTAVETFSLAMLESMAMGVPLVATDMGGTREAVLDGETGLLVAANDVSALANGLVRLVGDDAYRQALGRNARNLVLERFTEAKMILETEQVLELVTAHALAGSIE